MHKYVYYYQLLLLMLSCDQSLFDSFEDRLSVLNVTYSVTCAVAVKLSLYVSVL